MYVQAMGCYYSRPEIHRDAYFPEQKIEVKYGNSNREAFESFGYLHGLVLKTSTESYGRHRIRSPVTKQVLQLPDPEAPLEHMVIVFVSSTAEYKVIYVHRKSEKTDLVMKVLTAGTDLAWRPLRDFSVSCGIALREKTFMGSSNGLVYLDKFCGAPPDNELMYSMRPSLVFVSGMRLEDKMPE